MRFELATAGRVVFGAGCAAEAVPAARALGTHALVVTGRSPDRAARLVDGLKAAGLGVTTFAVAGEPSTDDVRAAVARAGQAGCDVVIGLGGGSALDAGKAVAMLLGNGGDPLDYLEVVGRGLPIARPSAPFVAIPTTAGTGSEVTRNAVLASKEHGAKASLRSPSMLPPLALVDPELLRGTPPSVLASTGLDALTQLVEPFLSVRANPLTDVLCRDGIPRSARSLRRAVEGTGGDAAFEDLALASLYGGMALANAGLGAVHGLAAPLGGMFPAPHGAVCARLLPVVLDANLAALRARDAASPALGRLEEVARLLTGHADARAEDGIAWLATLVDALEVPRLGAWGLAAADFPCVAAAGLRASSMKGNPVALTAGELTDVLARAA